MQETIDEQYAGECRIFRALLKNCPMCILMHSSSIVFFSSLSIPSYLRVRELENEHCDKSTVFGLRIKIYWRFSKLDALNVTHSKRV